MYGLRKFSVQFLDEMNKPIVAGLKVTVLSADGAIATVYSDDIKTSLTNPITSTVFATLDNGVVAWWGAETSYDVEVVNEKGVHAKWQGLSPSDQTLRLAVNRADSQLVYANTAAGAELVDDTGVDVDYPNSVTLSGEELKAGDVVEIVGQVLCADFHSTPKLEIRVEFGTEEIMNTGDCVIAANDDTITFHLWVTINTAGAGGKIKTTGYYITDLNGTVALAVVAPTGAAKEASEDLSGDVPIVVTGDYELAHADQESYLVTLNVFVHHNGNV